MACPDKPTALGEDETLDDLLHGELKIIQGRKGFRYSVDALLLSHFSLPLVRGKDVLDMGAGAGVVGLILARRGSPCSVTAVEIQEVMADRARRSAELNATVPPVRVVHADALLLAEQEPGRYQVVVTNPPFRARGAGLASPDPERAAARHEVHMTLPEWLRAARDLLAPEGRVCVVFPTGEEERLEKAERDNGFFLARRLFATDRPGGRRVLVLRELAVRDDLAPVEMEDIPIQNATGKFGIDGYR